MNEPVPLPFVVWLSVMDGFALVLQQMPRAEIEAPPSAVTFPPPVAVVCVIAVIELVVIVGNEEETDCF